MSSMNRRPARGVAALALVLVLSACSNTLVAPTPTPPNQSPSAGSTDTPGPSADVTATPVSTPKPTPTSAAKPTPTATPTPVASGSSTPNPSSPASACSGSPEHQAFFAEASSKLPFDVYCAVLPTGWFLQTASYELPNGGKLTVSYKGPGSATLALSEGAYCVTSSAECSPHVSIRGTAAFGDKPGMLDVLSTPPDVLVVYVDPGSSQGYSIIGTNLTQAKFVALAAALSKVPKS